MPRLYLLFVALLFAGFGLFYLLAPMPMAEAAGLTADASGRTDIRATYGGLQLGFALFLAWSAAAPARYAGALVAAAILGATVAAGRMLGLVVDGVLNAFHATGLVLELSLVAWSLWVYRRWLRTEAAAL